MSSNLLMLLFVGSAAALATVLIALYRARRRGRRPREADPVKSDAGPTPPARLPVERLVFSAHSSQLTPEHLEALRLLVAYLAPWPTLRIAVTGCADAAGNPSQNRRLARERARAVAGALRMAGLAADRVEVGWNPPEAAPSEAERRALRCVVIRAEIAGSDA